MYIRAFTQNEKYSFYSKYETQAARLCPSTVEGVYL